MISARDELVNLRNQISQMNYRINRLAALSTPSNDPTATAFMDHFSDSSLHWGYRVLNTSGAKTILEPAGSALNFHIDLGTAADWSNATDAAPHLSIGPPGFPCEIIAKVNSLVAVANANAGIFFGRGAGVGADYAVLFGPYAGGVIRAYPLGAGAMNSPAFAGFPLWIKIRMTANWNYGYVLTCWYSQDNIIWTQYEHPLGTPWQYWTGYLTYVGCTGLYLKNWTTSPLADASFDYFQMVRSFGPGGI
jgi:hypothetical protein